MSDQVGADFRRADAGMRNEMAYPLVRQGILERMAVEDRRNQVDLVLDTLVRVFRLG